MSERLVRRQLRANGELLLRERPPADEDSLRAVESSAWSENWTDFYERHPDLRPRREGSTTIPRARVGDELAAVLTADGEYVLVVSVRGSAEAVGVPAGTVAGTGAAVTGYVVALLEDGEQELVLLDEPGGTALLVDQDEEEAPGMVLLEQYRWPDPD